MDWAASRVMRSRFRQNVFSGFAAAIALLLLCVVAHAETRVALVIGNGDYRNTTKLSNPRNDATDVAAALKRMGFSTIVGLDLDKAGMDDVEIRFARAARNADMAIFYYSGHAIQYAATNYLLPIDAQIRDSADLRRLAKVDDVVADLQQAKDLRIMVLDSCRDNPLADELKRSLGERSSSVQRGLARLGSTQGMIVAYSTSAGQTADDGTGRNSPYTAALLKQIETPQEISTIFKKVSLEVFEKTDRRQIPEISLSIFRDFYLKAPTDPAPATVLSSIPPATEPGAPSGTLPGFGAPHAVQIEKFQDKTSRSASQRVVLYDEDKNNPQGKMYMGTVVWSTEPVKATASEPADVAVHADIDIPDRKFKMTISFRRNTDKSLPASHTAELTFMLPADFADGGIANVPGILMKSTEDARGVALAGLGVKVTDGFFLVALSNVDADRIHNLQLLKERAWFDIPLLYTNQRRAILAIEKGAAGERAYAEAFAFWKQ
jgi:Caspase domain